MDWKLNKLLSILAVLPLPASTEGTKSQTKYRQFMAGIAGQ